MKLAITIMMFAYLLVGCIISGFGTMHVLHAQLGVPEPLVGLINFSQGWFIGTCFGEWVKRRHGL